MNCPPKGKYHTAGGSILRVSGKYGLAVELEWDWIEENACIDCQPDPYPEQDGDKWFLTWACDYCGGGKAEYLKG